MTLHQIIYLEGGVSLKKAALSILFSPPPNPFQTYLKFVMPRTPDVSESNSDTEVTTIQHNSPSGMAWTPS